MSAEKGVNRCASNRYDSFFVAGTYLMVPELIRVSTFSKTKSMVRMGLILDDCWDFGINRQQYGGSFVTSDELERIVDPNLGSAYKAAREETYKSLANSRNTDYRERQTKNLGRFEAGIMQTEALALAIPYTPDYWTDDLVDKYRSTDARVWGAMMVALIPNSGLNLPEVPNTPVSTPTEAVTSMETLHGGYGDYLMSLGSSGRLAMALSAEMMFVQIQMDMFDRYINKELNSPAFSAFGNSTQELSERSLEYLASARALSPRRMTPSRIISRSFPLVYKLCADSSEWRNIAGWQNIRGAEV